VPTNGPLAGGNRITVGGAQLGLSTADITQITVAGTPAAAWTWVTATRVLVQTSASSAAGTAAVNFTTTAHGQGGGSLYTYNPGASTELVEIAKLTFSSTDPDSHGSEQWTV
jgi:hypothetical protein